MLKITSVQFQLPQERQTCNDRKALAKHLAKRLRMAAVNQERKKLQEQFKDGQKSKWKFIEIW